ncbi:Myo-inositol-1-phosphate synthase [Candidatus Bilamarchaeum dharawalense]|uniref:Myo-inositol-1-phosphate synthase n=1 Tax=Candidatus Bilamarchaeum dharawalense TaxID=2885759 RepID=A0A5E4LTH2_9ARCH|nr:Myo-inositol-1-phosphate synthase [Candidatus Bilamarchaeum dharawalense]
MGKIRCAVVGVGNCFAGLVQGIEYYKRHPNEEVTGVMYEKIGGYTVHDIEFVASFDVAENKVGKTLAKAVYEYPNKVRWTDSVSCCSGTVKESPILDGVGIYVENMIKPIKQTKTVEQLKKEAIEEIKKSGARIILNHLPVGSQKATEFWADIALETGCGMVNAMPVFIASDVKWAQRFTKKNLPIVGDDYKGMIGATIVHRTLAKLCDSRGTKIDKTYQINVGGNTDFINMLERDRLQSKKISKTESVQSQLSKRLPDDQIYVGPSDFIPFLGNTKLMFMRIEGRMWANIPYNMEVRLEVDDKANSSGVSADALRYAQFALDKKVGGPLVGPSAWLMKHPLKQFSDSKAKELAEKFAATGINAED